MIDYDLTQATLYNTPQEVVGWAVTTAISSVAISPDGFTIQFDKRASWPDVIPPGWTGPLQYTIGLVRTRDNSGSACIECWNDPKAFGGPVTNANQIATNWFYNESWGPLKGWQPQPGEMVGLFVAAGNLRGTDITQLMPPTGFVRERSNVVVFPWPAIGFEGILQFGAPVALPAPVVVPPAPVVVAAPPVAPPIAVPIPTSAPVLDPGLAASIAALVQAALNAQTAILTARIATLESKITASAAPQAFVGSIFGASVTLTAKK